MSAAGIAHALGDARRKGRTWRCRCPLHGDMRWFIVPGGQVTDAVAGRILARRDVQPHDSGLFPGCEQTFQLRGDWRGRHS